MKILLVDDERYAIDGLTNLLNWKSFDGKLIGTASNGIEALSIINATQPDVIISDIKMRHMDGLELAKEVNNLFNDIHMILLSAHSEFTYAQLAIKYNVKDYILKPIDREKLIQLEKLLININEKRNNKKASYLHTFDSSLRNEIIMAFSKGDKNYFDNFFKSKEFINSMKSDTCNVIGIQLINYIYNYLSELKVNDNIISTHIKNDIAKFYDITTIEEKKNYIISRYNEVLTNINHKKCSNIDSIASVAKKYIDNNYTSSDFNISFLAEELNVSISYLSTIFKQNTGVNLITYITEKRLNKAKELLSDLHYSIADISQKSGYYDSKYFSKIFKKKMNMTPSEYRNLNIQHVVDDK